MRHTRWPQFGNIRYHASTVPRGWKAGSLTFDKLRTPSFPCPVLAFLLEKISGHWPGLVLAFSWMVDPGCGGGAGGGRGFAPHTAIIWCSSDSLLIGELFSRRQAKNIDRFNYSNRSNRTSSQR
jgi:hypothetical protein